MAPARTWWLLSQLAPLPGVACIGGLLWAVSTRLERWEIHPFVLLAYGAMGCAVLGSLGAWRHRSGGGAGRDITRDLRGLLWLAVLVLVAWVWFEPTEALVGWWLRMVTWWRYGDG